MLFDCLEIHSGRQTILARAIIHFHVSAKDDRVTDERLKEIYGLLAFVRIKTGPLGGGFNEAIFRNLLPLKFPGPIRKILVP